MFSALIFSVFCQNIQQDAESNIVEAQTWLNNAYEAILDAEKAEANVSGLLVQFNDAANLLSLAHMSYDVGDFDEASSYAESTIQSAIKIANEAQLLENDALDLQVQNSWSSIIFSVVAVFAVIVGSFFGYRFFKSYYYGQLSKMKPRVEE